jgi:hypothetical protein
MQLFLEASVEALAFREHGGATGHEELFVLFSFFSSFPSLNSPFVSLSLVNSLKKRAATQAKKAENARKRKLGEVDTPAPSTPSKKPKTSLYGFDAGSDDEDEDDEDYVFVRDGSPTPAAGPSGSW